MNGKPAVAILGQGVTHSYKHGALALDNASFAWPPGIIGLLGPNGAGKSTLMKLLVGALPLTDGTIQYGYEQQRIGFLPQQAGWPGTFQVHELLEYAAWWHGVPRGKTEEAVSRVLADLNLVSFAGVRLSRLSGGTHRRVMIAQAVVHSPHFVVLDEPTAGLDIRQRRDVRALISRISHTQTSTIVISSHIVEDVEPISDWVCILDQGRVRLDTAAANLPMVEGRESPMETAYLALTER